MRYSKKYLKKTKKTKKIFKKQKGGETCENEKVSCDYIKAKNYSYNKVNQVWKICIYMNGINNHIIYLTELNVLIKNIETIQIPHFYIKIPEENYKGRSKILIEDKFIGCFLKICGEWYAIMRLFGKTLNTGMLARTETNKVFYKLKNINFDLNDLEKDSGIIDISNKHFTKKQDTYFLSNSTTPILLLNPYCYENITTQNKVFDVLQYFRQREIIATSIKVDVAKTIIDFLFGLINTNT